MRKISPMGIPILFMSTAYRIARLFRCKRIIQLLLIRKKKFYFISETRCLGSTTKFRMVIEPELILPAANR